MIDLLIHTTDVSFGNVIVMIIGHTQLLNFDWWLVVIADLTSLRYFLPLKDSTGPVLQKRQIIVSKVKTLPI